MPQTGGQVRSGGGNLPVCPRTQPWSAREPPTAPTSVLNPVPRPLRGSMERVRGFEKGGQCVAGGVHAVVTRGPVQSPSPRSSMSAALSWPKAVAQPPGGKRADTTRGWGGGAQREHVCAHPPCLGLPRGWPGGRNILDPGPPELRSEPGAGVGSVIKPPQNEQGCCQGQSGAREAVQRAGHAPPKGNRAGTSPLLVPETGLWGRTGARGASDPPQDPWWGRGPGLARALLP